MDGHLKHDLAGTLAAHYRVLAPLVGEETARALAIQYQSALLQRRDTADSSDKPAANAANDLSGVIARLDAIERDLDQLSDSKPESVTDEERQQHELEIAGRDLAIRNLAAELRKSLSAEDIQRVMARAPEPGRKAAWRV